MEKATASRIIQENPDWDDDVRMHALFCSFDDPVKDQWALDFWKRAINKIAGASDVPLLLTESDLMSIFERKGRRPLALEGVVPALLATGDLLEMSTIQQNSSSKKSQRLSWSTWLRRKASSLFSSPETDRRFIIKAYLAVVTQALALYVSSEDRKLFSYEEIAKYLQSKWQFNEEEMNAYLDFLYTENGIEVIHSESQTLLQFQPDGTSIEKELAIMNLKTTKTSIENTLHTLSQQKKTTHQEVLAALRTKNREEAKEHLKREKLIAARILSLNSSRNSIEQQIINITSAETNSLVLNAIKSANAAQASTMIKIEEVEDALEEQEDLISQHDHISSLLSQNQLADDEELLRELEQLPELEIPTPPSHPLPARQEEEDKKLEFA